METLLVAALIVVWLFMLVPAALVTLLPANPFAIRERSPRPKGPIPFPPSSPTHDSAGGQAVA